MDYITKEGIIIEENAEVKIERIEKYAKALEEAENNNKEA